MKMKPFPEKKWHLWKVDYKDSFDLDFINNPNLETGYYAIFVSEDGDIKKVRVKI